MKHQFLCSFILASIILALGIGCQKNDTSVAGGKGGKATLLITPVHFGLNVDSCMVYIKYATSDAPANNIYDDSSKCFLVDTTPIAVFCQLKKGQYYIFGDGYHLFYNSYVKGGIPITLSVEDSSSVLLPTSQYFK